MVLPILVLTLLAQPLPPSSGNSFPTVTSTAGSGVSGFKMSQGARFCLNNTACTAYISYDGTYIDLSKPLLITQSAANTGFNFTTTQVKLSLGNSNNYIIESPNGSPSSLPAWQFAGMSQLQILGSGTNEGGTLMLKQSHTGAYNTLDFQDNAGTLKWQIGYGNSATISPYTSSPFISLAASTDLPITNFSNVELARVTSAGKIKSSATTGNTAFEAAVGAKLVLGGATLSNDSSTRSVFNGDVIAGINVTANSGAFAAGNGSTPVRLRATVANTAGQCAVHAESQTTLSTNGAQIFCASPDNNSTTPFAVDYSGKLVFQTTDSTASPGAATINKPSGKSAVASTASSVVITNSIVTATTSVFLTPLDLDTTCTGWKAVAGSGSFTVTMNAACAATWKFQWRVEN